MTTNKEERHKRFDGEFPRFQFSINESPWDRADRISPMSDNAKVMLDFIDKEVDIAVAEERKRIEAVFEKHVPPHAMDLEDSIWLKRLLNKAFHNDNK